MEEQCMEQMNGIVEQMKNAKVHHKRKEN